MLIFIFFTITELFLNSDEVRKIHDFEEDCVDDYFMTKELNKESSTEERIKATNQRWALSFSAFPLNAKYSIPALVVKKLWINCMKVIHNVFIDVDVSLQKS